MKTVILQLLSLSSVFAIGNAQSLTCGADTLAVNDQCLCDTAACLNTTGTDVTELLDENVVYLAGIFDVANYGWGSTIFNFTVSLLNDKTDGWHDDVLLDTEIRYSIGDAACDADKAVAAYWNLRPMHAVVGCRCSGASAAVARIAGLEGVPQISPVSTSSKLDNYPLFSRTVAPDDERGEVGAVRSMLQAFGWNRVHILSTDTPFAKDIATDFRKLWQGEIASSATFTFTANGDIDPVSVAAVLSSIPVNDSRIILLAAHDQHSYPIIRQALEMGFQPDTVWVGMSWPGARMPSDTSWIPPIPGFIGLIPFRNRNSVYQDYIQRLQAAQAADGVEVWTEFDHYAVGYMVDSILAMATALGEVPVDQRRNGTLVTSTLRSLTLNGVSGELSFTDSGHRQDPRFTVSNMQKDADGNFRWVTIGSTGTEAGSTELYLNQTCFAEAGCGLKEAPSDTYPVPIEPVVDLWVAIVIPIIALLLVAVIIKYWRSHKKKVALKNTMSDMQKKMEEMKVIDDELLGIDDQVERAKLRKDSLILKRSALQDKPDHWCVSDKTLVEVEPNDDQYWDVTDRLQDTMSDAHVSKLWRIQNKSLWSYYSFHKDRLSMNGIDHNEQSVWHGTSNLDPAAIYNDRQDGFMMQFSSDGFWGRGIYFADKSAYSYGYSFKSESASGSSSDRSIGAGGEREMFLAKLLVGNEININRDESGQKAADCRALTVPPINPQTNLKYNTVTGHTGGSQVWIVYENGRAYPDYLVRYYRGKRDPKRTPFKSKNEAMKKMPPKRESALKKEQAPDVLEESDSSTDLELGVGASMVWEFLDNNGWKEYDHLQQVTLEGGYQAFLATSSKSLVQLKSDAWTYEVDLVAMEQTNTQHPGRRTRDVRRRASGF